jgi:hypothetical integral membrane protein (TIGR02206 family)
MNKFLHHHIEYKNFTIEHAVALLFFTIVIYALVVISKRYFTESQKRNTAIILSFIPVAAMLFRMTIDYNLKGLNLSDDLPLHLCRILTIAAPIIVLLNHEKSLKIFCYLVLAGVVNALITADIEYGFPYYGYFMYFLYHGFLVVLVFYEILIRKIHLGIRDGLQSFLTINVYFIILHLINIVLDSNYMYTRAKPSVASIMDVLGAWPYYILWIELIAFLLIFIIHLVFGKMLFPQKQGK